MSKEDNKDEDRWASIKLPIVRNVNPKLAADDIEGIPTEDMPRRMAEMFKSAYSKATETMKKELEEIRDTEGSEERF